MLKLRTFEFFHIIVIQKKRIIAILKDDIFFKRTFFQKLMLFIEAYQYL